MSELNYPFADLRPTLHYSRSVWDAEGEERQRLILREAVINHVRIEIIADDTPTPIPPR